MTIEVREGGLFSTIQDLGRHGLQQFGIPVSGAMDSHSAIMANRLVGNDINVAVIEITLSGPVLYFSSPTIVAFTGCHAPLSLDGRRLPAWESHQVEAGSILSVGSAVRGCRGYLAFAGGIDTAPVMGSRSTFIRGALGGLEGRALKKGDVLHLGRPGINAATGRFAPRRQQLSLPGDSTTLRVMLGPQDDLFTKDALDTLLSAEYTITAEADRMGYRMQGPKLTHVSKADILSDGIAPGSVQVPGHGQPIIMLADRQSIGGYAKIATVIGADLPLLSQMRPGQSIRFAEVSRDEAVAALSELTALGRRDLCETRGARSFSVRVGAEFFRVELQEIIGG